MTFTTEQRAMVLGIIDRSIMVPLSPRQRDALSSWMASVLFLNVKGPEAGVLDSKLIEHLNRGEYHAAAGEFGKWTLVNGKVSVSEMLKRRSEFKCFARGAPSGA